VILSPQCKGLLAKVGL